MPGGVGHAWLGGCRKNAHAKQLSICAIGLRGKGGVFRLGLTDGHFEEAMSELMVSRSAEWLLGHHFGCLIILTTSVQGN